MNIKVISIIVFVVVFLWNLIKLYAVYLAVEDQRTERLWKRYDLAAEKLNKVHFFLLKAISNK